MAADVHIAGRRIMRSVGTKSQTISVCTSDNRPGEYETRYRLLASADVSTAELEALADLTALERYVAARGGQREAPGPRQAPPQPVPTDVADPAWVTRAAERVAAVLDEFVLEFRRSPYLHRVEHSLHARLYQLLMAEDELAGELRLSSTGQVTQLVHKEWPETVADPSGSTGANGDDRGSRLVRGKFDLAVLSPQQVEIATLDTFTAGYIAAPIAIEVGLDYGHEHLADDVKKLTHSAVPHAFVLHLSRVSIKPAERTEIEKQLTSLPPSVKGAYVHLVPGSREVRWKLTGETAISSEPVGPPSAS